MINAEVEKVRKPQLAATEEANELSITMIKPVHLEERSTNNDKTENKSFLSHLSMDEEFFSTENPLVEKKATELEAIGEDV